MQRFLKSVYFAIDSQSSKPTISVMNYLEIYFSGLLLVVIAATLLWIVSVFIKNASIVDPFWGLGFLIAGVFYFYKTDGL